MTANPNPEPVKRARPGQSPRKPGGQPGNRNAFKHGLRSRKLTPVEVEQLKTRLILSAVEEAACRLNRELVRLAELRRRNQPFVGEITNPSDFRFSRAGSAARPSVLVEPARLKGFVNLKIFITIPMPEILASEASLQDSIREIAFAPRSTNDSGQETRSLHPFAPSIADQLRDGTWHSPL